MTGSLGEIPQVAKAYLGLALLSLVIGMSLGIYMGAHEWFLLRPVHAHLNLLGWVTNAIFGIVIWLEGANNPKIAWRVLASFNLGNACLLVGLTFLLLEYGYALLLILSGETLVVGAVAGFGWYLWRIPKAKPQ